VLGADVSLTSLVTLGLGTLAFAAVATFYRSAFG
jgi:hypothetical protein